MPNSTSSSTTESHPPLEPQTTESLSLSSGTSTSTHAVDIFDSSQIVVVAWDGEDRERVARILSEHGHGVVRCSSAKEARGVCEHRQPDGVVLVGDPYGMEQLAMVRWLCACTSRYGAKPYLLAMIPFSKRDEIGNLLAAGVDDCIETEAGEFDWMRAAKVMESVIEGRKKRAASSMEQVQMRRRYENLFIEAPDAMLVLKASDGRIIGVNRAVSQVFSVSGKDLFGKYLSLIFSDYFAGGGRQALDQFLASLAKHPCLNYRLPDGSERLLHLSVAPVPWENGGNSILLTCRDVSSLAEKGEKSGNEAKTRAIASMARGIGNQLGDSLTTISGNVELLAARPGLGAESLELVDRIRKSCEKSWQIGESLRKIADAGFSRNGENLPLCHLVRRVVDFALLKRKHHRPIYRFHHDPMTINGNASELKELLEEVIANATESMEDRPEGLVRVRFSRVNLSEHNPHALPSGEYARVVIEDEGVGLPPGDVNRLFDPFFTTREGRDGLGLTRAATLATRHGGKITASPRREGGAEVELFLPISNESLGEGDLREFAPDPVRVLFLEDELEIRHLVEKGLERKGCEVFSVATGPEAMQAEKRACEIGCDFDILVLDVQLRGSISGVETLRRLRQAGARQPALMLTGMAETQSSYGWAEDGFSGIIRKPFKIDQLHHTILSLLDALPGGRGNGES